MGDEMTVTRAAELLGISRKSALALIQTGTLPARWAEAPTGRRRKGDPTGPPGYWVVREADVRDLLARRRATGSPRLRYKREGEA